MGSLHNTFPRIIQVVLIWLSVSAIWWSRTSTDSSQKFRSTDGKWTRGDWRGGTADAPRVIDSKIHVQGQSQRRLSLCFVRRLKDRNSPSYSLLHSLVFLPRRRPIRPEAKNSHTRQGKREKRPPRMETKYVQEWEREKRKQDQFLNKERARAPRKKNRPDGRREQLEKKRK